MKLCIAGSRGLHVSWEDFDRAASLFDLSAPSEIVVGRARGVDQEAETWAGRMNYAITRMPADWERHGRMAGMVRNRAMAAYSDALLAFWDGSSKGTANMISTMHSLKKPVTVVRL